MKKTLLISAGTILILILIATWVYVMFFGTPRSVDDVFGGFAENDTPLTAPTPPPVTPQETPPTTETTRALRQLTTKPVIGFREMPTATTSAPRRVLYAEAGTGHVFSIDLATGVEQRLSGTTIPEASRAVFSPDGRFVAIQSGFSRSQSMYLGEISTNENLIQIPFPDTAHQFTITADNTLLYTVRAAAETVGKSFSLTTRTERRLFTIPFREAVISWGSTANGPHYAYPAASHALEGFLYQVQSGTLSRLPVQGTGLVAFGSGALVGTSYFYGADTYESVFYSTDTRVSSLSSLRLLPEKCTGSVNNENYIWCASSAAPVLFDFPDSWYRGDISFADNLYALSFEEGSNFVAGLSNTLLESGREIDVINLQVNNTDDRLYFINKNDGNLWTYELPQ